MSDSRRSSSIPSDDVDLQLPLYRRTLIDNHQFLQATYDAVRQAIANILITPGACRSTLNQWTLQYAVLKSHHYHYVDLLGQIEDTLRGEGWDGCTTDSVDTVKAGKGSGWPGVEGHEEVCEIEQLILIL